MNSFRGAPAIARIRPAVWWVLFIALLIACVVVARSVFSSGAPLRREAKAGNAAAQYEYARWVDRHDWGDRFEGYRWLQKSAAQDYPPALFALGSRLKHGTAVPRPEGWTGPGGNVFAQPQRGQKLIDRAVELGFLPKTNDAFFTTFEFWRDFSKEDYDLLGDFMPQSEIERLPREFQRDPK